MIDERKARQLRLPLPYTCDMARAMVFVDGENLIIRYKEMLAEKLQEPMDHLSYTNWRKDRLFGGAIRHGRRRPAIHDFRTESKTWMVRLRAP